VTADVEVERALGRYRGPLFALVPVTILCLFFASLQVVIGARHHFQFHDWMSLFGYGAVVTALWFVPQTVVSTTGIRLLWRLRFIPWVDVARVYGSGPGDPNLLLGLVDGKRLSLPGVPADRLPGVLILARQATAAA